MSANRNRDNDQKLPWRQLKPGEICNRRPGRRRSHVGDVAGYGCHSSKGTDQQREARLGRSPSEPIAAVHLDDRVCRSSRQSQSDQRLAGSDWRRYQDHHSQSKNFGQRQVEFSCGVGLGDQQRWIGEKSTRLCSRDLSSRAGARHRRPRFNGYVRPAQDRRCSSYLGERSIPRSRRSEGWRSKSSTHR